MAAALAGCTAGAPAPPSPPTPVETPASLEPYQIYRSAELTIRASDATSCTSHQAAQRQLARNFVIGDLHSINNQYPLVPLAGAADRSIYVVMSMLNNDDTMPQWLVTAEDTSGGHSQVELRNGADPTDKLDKFGLIWAAVEDCDATH
ncbi:MAG: hypothetical protein ACREIB_13490 [Pseudomonadota bacterium]